MSGETSPRCWASRRCALATVTALVLAASACNSDESQGDESQGAARSVAFTAVEDGETWNDIAVRISGCADSIDLSELRDHLQRSNPIVVDVGLAADQLVAYDPTRLDGETGECDDDHGRTDVVAGADGNSSVEPTATSTLASPTTDVGVVAPAEEGATENGVDTPRSAGSVVSFEEAFESGDAMNRFRWQIHHAQPFQGTPATWHGDHDSNCGAPTTFRTVHLPPEGTDPGDAAYWCAPVGPESGHMMTTFRSTGYAQVAFSPDQAFDRVSRVCWDQNQTDLGSRKWTQVVVVPEQTFEANDERLDYVKPNLEDGPGASGVFLDDDVFLFVMQSGSTVTHLGRSIADEDFRGFVTEDKARRYTTCVEDLENGMVRIELERDDTTEVREQQGSFPDGPARVVFQDDTYNSTKSPSPVGEPFSWHWDDIVVETSP